MSKQKIMYALVNYQRKLLLDENFQFFTGLPETMASLFCFLTREEAQRMADRVVDPKFEILPVSIDADGRPSPVMH